MRRILWAVMVTGGLGLALAAGAAEENLQGTWNATGDAGEPLELEFDGWDTLTLRLGGTEGVIADYALEGTSLFITDIEGPLACDAAVATATYTVSLSPDRIELIASGDDCTARAARLNGRVFSRVK